MKLKASVGRSASFERAQTTAREAVGLKSLWDEQALRDRINALESSVKFWAEKSAALESDNRDLRGRLAEARVDAYTEAERVFEKCMDAFADRLTERLVKAIDNA